MPKRESLLGVFERLGEQVQTQIEKALNDLSDKEVKILLERFRGQEKIKEPGEPGNVDPYPKRIRIVNRYLVGMNGSEESPPDEIHVINPGGASPLVYKLDEIAFVQAKAELARSRGLIKERSDRFIRGRAKRLNASRKRQSKS